jgi:pimeloyl-ACP methyl ester carboxylesterase
MNPRVRHILITTAVVLVVILLAGVTYQGVSTALERRKYPRPGGLIDVGDHQLHLHCTGEGAPVVILEAPAGGFSAAWAWVQPEIARTTRVCSYDRAGLGWSEAGDRPFDPARVPDELHALLGAASVPAPYVLVGHSLGAAFTRVFAGRFPGEVAALVVIDPATDMPGEPPMLPLSPWLARAGLLRATGVWSSAADGLPEPALGAFSSFLNRPDHLTRASREVKRWNDAVQLGEAAELERIPVVTVQTIEGTTLDDEYFEMRTPLLSDPAVAKRAAARIVDVVEAARRKEKGSN